MQAYEALPSFKKIRDERKSSIADFLDSSLPYGANVLRVIDKFIRYPSHAIQSRVVASFLCQSLPLSDKAFCLFLQGESRSGKSTTGKLAAKLHGVETFGSNSIAACRNWIEDNKFLKRKEMYIKDADGEFVEANLFLILEDVSPEILLSSSTYQLLKVSCDRDTARSIIAGEERGKNMSFSTFCFKIVSSCYPTFSDPRFEELNNRSIFIRCERFEDELEQLEDYDLTPLADYSLSAWQNGRIAEYATLWKKARKPRELSMPQWEVSKPALIAGTIQGVFDSEESAIECFTAYWGYRARLNRQFIDPLELACKQAVAFWNAQPTAIENCIDGDWLTEELKLKIKNGKLPINRLYNAKLHEAMRRIGYEFNGSHWQINE